ncbi:MULTISPECIES: helix-turn-helix domain-containing protein [Salimicrobium]|uniref:Transcriptional regulator n=3 Tax=Salimicrobium TaxID=351195 RepID=K2GAK9_9BACI|nr:MULTISPECIES: helix-turn-helix domain-containing protein [Salimicrobium]AKG03746.1 transcriptional regulator [Salimicrobium jeotgali]EKE31397.1 transcriptional regulator SinR [Salimicrobium jeotgali]MBM7697006.1 XRE family transcriptional regulator of biofilm formation [Salimicrobium jeotgali]SDX80001.1 Anti-repressor SinI [Salimicrobium album]SIS82376.1 transcriptional regulator [Salimicrobium salexigens]
MIGDRIQHIRKNRGYSLSELAERANVAKSYLSSIERNIQKNPSVLFLEKISKELDVSMNYLLHGEQQDVNEPLDDEWVNLVKDAMSSGLSKEQFKDYLEFNKWKLNKSDKE